MSSELVRAIRNIAGVNLKDNLHLADAEVISISEANRTAQVQLTHGESNNIITARLMASVADGCFFYPSVGSTVVVAFSDFVEPYIAQYSDIDRIVWLGGEYEGVPIVIDPGSPTAGLLAKLNNIENLLNDLIDKYNIHTHPSNGAPPAPTFIELNKIAPITSQSDIQHPNITH